MGTLKTESFVNNAAQESGKFYTDKRQVENGTAGFATMSVSYNATTQSYTVTAGSNSQTFTQADKVNSGSSDFIAFNKASGSVNDSLSLTAPGTSGPLTYQYVGGGAWEHVVIGSTTLDFRYNPFTYGVATPDTALARTGIGLYSVSLVGALESTKPYAMAGSGTMQVDFLNGSLSSDGVLTSIDVSTGVIESLGIFYGSAALSSSTNAFSGTFAMDDGKRYTGGWQGRFYGPNNEEVGAVWHISSSAGDFGAGYLLGRTDSSLTAYNTSLLPIRFTETFSHRFANVTFTDNGNGTNAANPESLRSTSTLTYDATNGSYRYIDETRSIDTTFGANNLNSAKSNTAVTVYEMTGGGLNYRLTLSKPGSGNPNIALTYASFGHWEQAQSGATSAQDRWFTWGVRSNGLQIPTSGSGHFEGIVVGKGLSIGGGGPIYDLSGTSTFDVNFSAATFTGTLNPIGTSTVDGAIRDFGNYTVSSGVMDVDGGLAGQFRDGSNNYLGFFEGALYGPSATELGGTFGFKDKTLPGWVTPGPNEVFLSGAVLAKTTP